MSGLAAARNAIGRWLLAVVPVGGALVALTALPLVHLAPNRLVVGTAVSAEAVLGASLWPIVGLSGLAAGLLGAFARSRVGALVAVALLCAAFVLIALALGDAARDLTAGKPSATRLRLAAGAWTTVFLMGVAIGLAGRRTGHAVAGWLALAGCLAALAWIALAGRFDALSLAVEFVARREVVEAAFGRHLALCAGAVALAVIATVLLSASSRLRGVVDLAISGVQVVPAVALLGALVALTSALLAAFPQLRGFGLSALGPGPAILGIAAYLLLPLWRGLHAALSSPDPATIDAAAAIGMTRGQILRRVQLPLGAPILVGALRVAAVQSVGLATLGALVGAGGLGVVVFDGMAQFAPDLILLGAIPIVALSIGLDRGLAFVEGRVRGSGIA